jgi:hypothetical protein
MLARFQNDVTGQDERDRFTTCLDNQDFMHPPPYIMLWSGASVVNPSAATDEFPEAENRVQSVLEPTLAFGFNSL